MCGICGFWNSGESGQRELLLMMDRLAHRGPDDAALHLETVESAGGTTPGTIGLGHRRLSIIDLSPRGRQPMYSEDRDVVVVFNGEIYNFRALKGILADRGHNFISKTDSEVIAHGYEEWGEDLLAKLNGMFAMAIWDRREKKLILARDRLGIKPLYYHRLGETFLFASELNALRAHPRFRLLLDIEAIKEYLTFSYIPAPRTIYRHTFKLLPGECLIFQDGILKKNRYWDLSTVLEKRPGQLSFDEAREQCTSLIRDAVEKRLVSDVPLGAFLSGGYDSSLVVAMMREVGASRIETFTVGFKEQPYSEALEARRLATHLGTRHHELTLTAAEAMASLEEIATLYDEPFGDSSALPTYLVSRFTRSSGMVVALSGDGGDELFCGYPRYRTTRRLAVFSQMPRHARCLGAAFLRRAPLGKFRRIGRDIDFDSLSSLYKSRMSTWKEGDATSLLITRSGGGDPASSPSRSIFDSTFEQFEVRDLMNLLSLVDIHTYLVDDILTKVDRASMAVSLEVRVPLLDHRLVEFAVSLPSSYKVRNGNGKRLLKAVSAQFIPPSILNRPKRGFAIPVEPWLKGPLKGLLLTEFSRENVQKQGILRPEVVSELFAGFFEGRYRCARLVWSLLIFRLWLKSLCGDASAEELMDEREETERLHADPELLPTGRRV